MFVLAATVVLAIYRRGAVNTIGALVLSRVDVATIQFCHVGLRARGPVRRSQRKGWRYRVSDVVGAIVARAMERWAYRRGRCRRFVAVSSNLAGEVTRAFGRSDGEVDVISNGVDTAVFRPDGRVASDVRRDLDIAGGQLLAVFAGGDWERKGLSIAIDAIGMAPRWELLVVGKGDVPAYAARACAVGASVYFLGHTADPQRYYCAGDAFVFPTAYEGFALVVLEASACGLPLLVTASSGADRLLQPGVNGWFVERTAESVASYLVELEDEALRLRLGAAAATAAEGFAWPAIVDGYDRALSKVLGL
jgi:UDP-glucose:(heptosyl)LPS alpha-1,3-glucosyltransferase